MGIADMIPGVSGGTIAFLTGIYEELVHSISELDYESLQLLWRKRFSDFWKKINGTFLLTIMAGIATSLILFAGFMTYLLKHHAIVTLSFFFGLIVMSIPLVLRKIKWSKGTALFFVTGVALAYLFTILAPVQTPDSVILVFLAGAIAIIAMVIPGVSGVFILLFIGKYQTIVTALTEGNIPVILIFVIGCFVGLISISKILTKILHGYHPVMMALLSGFMIGALNKVWPWRSVIEYATNRKGDQIAVFDKSVLPWHFLTATGEDPQLFQAILMMAIGILLVVVTEKIAVRLKTKH